MSRNALILVVKPKLDCNISDDEVNLLQDPRHLKGALTCAPKQVP